MLTVLCSGRTHPSLVWSLRSRPFERLRLDAQARALANTTVTSGGQPLVDNAQIPAALRGYVQLALDRGVLQAFPAEVIEVSPGVFQAVPGPRFDGARSVKRVEFLDPMLKVINILFGE